MLAALESARWRSIARCPDLRKTCPASGINRPAHGTVCAVPPAVSNLNCRESPETAGEYLESAPKAAERAPSMFEAGRRPSRQKFLNRARILAVGAILLLGIGAWFGFDILRQFRLAQDRAIAVNLNADAQALAAKNQPADARVRYMELADFLALRAGDDPQLKKMAGDVNNLIRLDRQASAKAAATGPGVAKARSQTPASPGMPIARIDPSPIPATTQTLVEKPPANVPDSQVAVLPATSLKLNPWPAKTGAGNPAPAGRPEAHPVGDMPGDVSDEAIGRAIQSGANYLIKQFDPRTFELQGRMQADGTPTPRDGYHDGSDILCVYALMQCGEAINDPRVLACTAHSCRAASRR